VQNSVFLSDCKQTWIFSTEFTLVAAAMVHKNKRTDSYVEGNRHFFGHKFKCKVHPRRVHEDPEALGGVGWSRPRPGRFTPVKETRYLYSRLGGPQDHSGHVRKISLLLNH